MKKLVLLLPLILNLAVLPAQTSITSDDPGGIILTKINSQGAEQPFTIKDAVKVVRFFMAQEGIQKCESDLDKNTLKIVTRRGYDPVKILLNPALHNQVSDMGYKIEFRTALKAKSEDAPVPTTTTKSTLPKTTKSEATKSTADTKSINPDNPTDCNDCGDQKVSKEAIDRLVTPDAYDGSSILIDFDSDSPDSGGMDFENPGMSEAQLDSIRRVFFKPDGPK